MNNYKGFKYIAIFCLVVSCLLISTDVTIARDRSNYSTINTPNRKIIIAQKEATPPSLITETTQDDKSTNTLDNTDNKDTVDNISVESKPKPETQQTEETTEDISPSISNIQKQLNRNNILSLVAAILSIVNFALLGSLCVLLYLFKNNTASAFKRISKTLDRQGKQIKSENTSQTSQERSQNTKRNRNSNLFPNTESAKTEYQQQSWEEESYNNDDETLDSYKNQSWDNEYQEEAPVRYEIDSNYYELVESYYNDPKSLSQRGTKVSISEDSLEKGRLGSNQAKVLNKDRAGDYFVINDTGTEYLFPKPRMKINKYSYKALETLFICEGYKSTISENFEIVKPAKVQTRSQDKEWVLKEQGILRFP